MTEGGLNMNGGVGSKSYVQNSSYQRGVLEIVREKIEEQINENMEIIKQIVSNGTITIGVADFGCATGMNSFPALETITQSLYKIIAKHTSLLIPEIVVYFNDGYSNDFNTLFSSLPRERNYHAVGLPGGFHGRLLPKSSLHVAYSSWSLHWLTEVPKELVDPASLAWNKGSIIWTRDKEHVRNAYLKQFVKDMGSFLEARSEELVGGGMMALLIPGNPNDREWDALTQYTITSDIELLGSGLYDMAKMGRISEAQVDSFNVSLYFPTPEEIKEILHEKSHLYTIEKMETVDNPGKLTLTTPSARAGFFRAAMEKIITNHFGNEIIDELFQLYEKKLEASPVFGNPVNDKSAMILLILKRK